MEVLSMTATLKDEVRDADLGDERLNKRLGKIIEQLGASPTLSIPAATDGRAEMEAAYRFFDNNNVTPQKILQPHIDATLETIAQCERVVLVQDTTELDLTRPSQQVQGAGPMDSDARRGAFMHPLVAFDSDGLPLRTLQGPPIRCSREWRRQCNCSSPAAVTHQRESSQRHFARQTRIHSGSHSLRCEDPIPVFRSFPQSIVHTNSRRVKQPNLAYGKDLHLIHPEHSRKSHQIHPPRPFTESTLNSAASQVKLHAA